MRLGVGERSAPIVDALLDDDLWVRAGSLPRGPARADDDSGDG